MDYKGKIKRELKKRRLSEKELIKRLQLPRSTYYYQFSDKGDPSIGFLKNVSKILDFPVSEFFTDASNLNEPAEKYNSKVDQVLVMLTEIKKVLASIDNRV